MELLGGGPITFELVPGMQTGPKTCEEFCPDLVLTSEGGQFYAAWVGFVGKAGLTGGLDCRTGEFRAEMVNGVYGLNFDENADPDATLETGEMTGSFVGHVSATNAAEISGEIMCLASGFAEITGVFNVTRSP